MTDNESSILMLFSFIAELTKESRFFIAEKPSFKSRIAPFLKQNMRGSAHKALLLSLISLVMLHLQIGI